MEYSFRKLERSDIQSVKNIINQHTSEYYTDISEEYIREYIHSNYCIVLVAERQNGEIIGYAAAILYTESTPITDFDIRNPTVINYPEYPLLLLKQCYIDSKYQGNGIGTEFIVERIKWVYNKSSINAVFVECWVKPSFKSSDELYESLPEFHEVYTSKSYYDSYLPNSFDICNGCLHETRNCKCSGSIYLLKNISTFLEKMN